MWILFKFFTFTIIYITEAKFNLYLEEFEAARITGVAGELHYVSNGTIQHQAFQNSLLIPTHINEVKFMWYNKMISNDFPIFYSANIFVHVNNIIQPPEINIRNYGEVPAKPTGLKILLKCIHDGIIDVALGLNVTLFSTINITCLVIKLQKICYNIDTIDLDYTYQNNSIIDKWESINDSKKLFFIGVGFSCFVVLTFFFILLACYFHTRRGAQVNSRDKSESCLYQSSYSSLSEGHNRASLLCETEKNIPKENNQFEAILQKALVPIEDITISSLIEEGMYGRRYKATYTNGTVVTPVTIKLFKDSIYLTYHEKCFKSSLLFFELKHNQILQLLCCAKDNNNQPLFVYPMFNGVNLKVFLRQCNPEKNLTSETKPFGAPQMATISSQICLAIIYLHGLNIIHKDISARNCILTLDWEVKLTDGLLSEDIFPGDYEGLDFQPIRWLPPETIDNQIYSVYSDVWAFGVTIWELSAFGDLPYSDVTVDELLDYLLAGYRLSQPLRCSNEMFSIMACCWSLMAEDRSDLSELCLFLQQFYMSLKQYV